VTQHGWVDGFSLLPQRRDAAPPDAAQNIDIAPVVAAGPRHE
jgi:hypothetical protein